jgi:hypothetical protein
MKLVVLSICIGIAAASLAGCIQTAQPYGQAPGSQYASDFCGDGWGNCQPSSTYKPRCYGDFSACGYDAARNRTDANPNN